MKTTEYYARRNMNFYTPAGLGFTKLVIFTRTSTGIRYDAYERNNKTGYCKDYFSGKRISSAKWNEMIATAHRAF